MNGMPVRDTAKIWKRRALIISVILLVVLSLFFVVRRLLLPKLSINGSSYVKVLYGEHYDELGCSASHLGTDLDDSIEYDGEVDEAVVGVYDIKCSITENNITLEKTRKVEIADDIAPVVVINGEHTINMCPSDEYIEEGYSASDNYDGDLTSLVKVKKKQDRIIYSVRDSSNNEGKAVRILNKKDLEYPVISLEGQLVYNLELGTSYEEPGYSAFDNCDEDLTSKVEVNGEVDTSKEGSYIISYSVSDSSGNITNKERTINVRKNVNDASDLTSIIYLTFNDGPSKTITPKILDLLKSKNIKATFFVINHDDSELDQIIKRAYDEGHTIALHSYSNSYKTVYSSVEGYFDDLNKLSDKIFGITGERPKIIRFIGGSSNTVSRRYSKGIMTKLVKEVIDKGYHYFDWNVESLDDEKGRAKNEIYKSVINGLSKDKYNVVLMHDYEDNYRSLEALSDIIDYGISHGYEFKAIDMSTPMVKHRVNN